MSRRLAPFGCLLGLLVLAGVPAHAEDFLVIFDVSGSMGSGVEIEPAKHALRETMDQLRTPGARWGLRVFGTGCCKPDTQLVIPLASDGRSRIRDLLPSLRGVASSPMPAALAASRREELASHGAWRRRAAIIVSDGLVDRDEACYEARLLRRDGVRVTVIGLEFTGTPEGRETLRYVAEAPNCAAGNYLRAERPDSVGRSLLGVARALYGFPYRLIAFLLSVIAAFANTCFLEFVLERQTRLRREHIPRLCNTAFLLGSFAAFLFFLGSSIPTVLAIVAAAILVTVLLATMLSLRRRSALP